MKRCRGDCGEEKPLDAFYPQHGKCKVCFLKKQRESKKRKRDSDKRDKDKVCKGTCGKLLPGIKFGKGKTWCKVCEAKRQKQWRDADKQDKYKICKGIHGCGKLLPGERFGKGFSTCKACRVKYAQKCYKEDNLSKPKICKGKYGCGKLLNGDQFSRGRGWCKNCDKKRKHTEEYREKNNAYRRKRHKSDRVYALWHNLRNRFGQWLKGTSKSAHMEEMVACTPEQLHDWKDRQFLPGMTLDHKDVVIDHMIPLKSFNSLDPEEQRKACHYTNLQPLWAKDNNAKRDKEIYDMVWIDDHWHIKLGDKYMSRKVQVKKGISTHDYYPISTFYS